MPKVRVSTSSGIHPLVNVIAEEDLPLYLAVEYLDDAGNQVSPPAGLTITMYTNGVAGEEWNISQPTKTYSQNPLLDAKNTYRFKLNQPILFDTLFLYEQNIEAVQQLPQIPKNGEYGFSFDFEGTGNANYGAAYKPGTGWFGICKLGGVPRIWNYQSKPINPTSWDGIGGYDLASPYDRVFAFDYLSTGKLDHLVCYRPGHGTIMILKHEGGVFSRIFGVGEGPAKGIQGFPLNHTGDQVFACMGKTGNYDCLALRSPDSSTTTVLR